MRADAGGYLAWRTGIPRLSELTGDEPGQIRAKSPALLLAAIRNAESSGPPAVSGKGEREPGRGGAPDYPETQAPPVPYPQCVPGGA